MIALLALFLLTTSACAQSFNPQAAATAGVHDLWWKSGESLAWNPATLSPNRGFRMSFEGLSFGAGIANNAFSVRYWNNNIAGDHFLTDEDKQDILNRIPDGGLRGYYQTSAPLVGFTYNRFGARVALESAGEAALPRDLAAVILYGNELNYPYGLADFAGESQSLMDWSIGFGYRVEQEQIPDLHLGVGFHFYQGLALAKVARSEGDLTVTDSVLQAAAVIHTITSDRGDGVGFDLGAMAVLSERWEVGLAVQQISSRISWRVDDNDQIVFYTDSAGIIVDSLNNDNYRERALHYSDTSYTGGYADTHLPLTVQLNARFAAARRWVLLGDATIRTESTSRGPAGLEAGIAAEWQPRRFLVLQSGVTVGGPWRSRFAIGGGLRFGAYECDLGWSWNGGLINAAHGIGFGLSQRLNF